MSDAVAALARRWIESAPVPPRRRGPSAKKAKPAPQPQKPNAATVQSKLIPARTDAERGWTPTRLAELKKLWAEDVATPEIGRRLGITKDAVIGKAHRERLPAKKNPAPRVAEGETPAAETIRYRAYRKRKAAKKAEERGTAARDVPVGQPWSFKEHRTLAEIDAASAVPPPIAKPVSASLRDLLRYLALDVGVAVFGPDDDGLYTLDQKKRFGVEGLLKEANIWRERRAEPSFVLAKEAA